MNNYCHYQKSRFVIVCLGGGLGTWEWSSRRSAHADAAAAHRELAIAPPIACHGPD
jgi:hypothetical protein